MEDAKRIRVETRFNLVGNKLLCVINEHELANAQTDSSFLDLHTGWQDG